MLPRLHLHDFTENHVVTCMLWKNSSYRFFSAIWDALGKDVLVLVYSVPRVSLLAQYKNLSKNPMELHHLFKETSLE